MSRPPRFRFVPSLALSLPAGEARRVLAQGLGLPEIPRDDEDELAFSLGKATLFVDGQERAGAPAGFLPLFVTDDLEAARAHLTEHGLTIEPMPWAPEAPGFLARAASAAFCVAHEGRVLEHRAGPALDATDDDDGEG